MDRARIGDICEVLNGFAFRSENYVESGIRIIRIANVQKGYIEDSTPVFYPNNEKEIEKYRLESGDLLMSLTGNVGRVAVLTDEFLPAALNQRVACLRMKSDRVSKGYLYHILNSNYFENQCLQAAKGVAQKNMSTEWLKEYEIPLFPKSKQTEIVSILDSVSSVIAMRQQQLSALDDLIKARFVEMFGDFKTNPMGWPVVSFEAIAIIDGNMTTDYERYANYPHIGIDSIEKDTGILKGYRTVAEDGVISGKYVFTPEHIIYSKIRPNLNKVALPTFAGLCSADAYPILPIKDKCNRVFLAYDMRSKFFLDYILQFCNRTNLPKVNRKEVSGFKTPLPPIALQNEFSGFVAQIDKSKSVIQKSLDETQLLFDSSMQKYFG